MAGDYAVFAVSSSSFGTVVHISRKGCTLALFQRICCFLFIRLPIISLTALFINAVEIGSERVNDFETAGFGI